ncbi:uncharacterized protein LOC113861397 [Abrus precatorius]|uniref:Uncharacterized protein LOC113861397 n=1 Tax=Abrus precatorius TaxID=3816 RepID=A0A8B8L5N1_ABRPR|nr:uncharacterized protein LOC113861397 [Abrus precatorius]
MEDARRSKNNKKGGLITRTWERCKSMSIGRGRKAIADSLTLRTTTIRSKSWPNAKDSASVAPQGCFSVYVGPQMQRFVIKTEYANHPLFKMLLEEAESEYGYNSQGPLALPCDVHIFYKVLMEMDCQQTPQGCAFLKRSSSSYHLLTPPPMLSINPF